MSYKIIELEQGSQEWLSYRKTKITATDTGVIMGLNPWKTPLMLWEEKLGLREPTKLTEKMAEGTRLEEDARKFLNSACLEIKPIILESTEYNFMMASLDGINVQGGIVEIKCGKGSHELALKNEVPPYYYSQCQKQMYVAGVKSCHYFSYRSDEDNVSIYVDRDNVFITKMIEAEKAFYKCLIDFTPPDSSDKDFILKDDADWFNMASSWKNTKTMLKELEEKEAAERQALIDMCGGLSSYGAGVKISKCIKKGTVLYKNIPELATIDLEIYRSKPSTYYRISENG